MNSERFRNLELDGFVPPEEELKDHGFVRETVPVKPLVRPPALPPVHAVALAAAIPGAVILPTQPVQSADGLPPDHYRAFVGYAPLPSMEELRKEFLGGVSVVFDGRPWQEHSSCAGIIKTPGEKEFWAALPPAELLNDNEKIIAWGDTQGYRPATHQEAVEFARAHPDPQRQFWIIILGSSASAATGSSRCSARIPAGATSAATGSTAGGVPASASSSSASKHSGTWFLSPTSRPLGP